MMNLQSANSYTTLRWAFTFAGCRSTISIKESLNSLRRVGAFLCPTLACRVCPSVCSIRLGGFLFSALNGVKALNSPHGEFRYGFL